MASTTTSKTEPSNTVPDHGDHDRVQMLSLHPDGTPAQLAPELIGDKEAVREATREQFRQQAVAAADIKLRGVSDEEPSETDPEKLTAAHQKAEKAAESAADKVVEKLHKGLGD